MTLAEALAIPKGMDFQEYEKLLKEKKKLVKQINKASEDIYSENDSLEVLAGEKGSDRYNRRLEAKMKAEAKVEKAKSKLQVIMERIGQ